MVKGLEHRAGSWQSPGSATDCDLGKVTSSLYLSFSICSGSVMSPLLGLRVELMVIYEPALRSSGKMSVSNGKKSRTGEKQTKCLVSGKCGEAVLSEGYSGRMGFRTPASSFHTSKME